MKRCAAILGLCVLLGAAANVIAIAYCARNLKVHSWDRQPDLVVKSDGLTRFVVEHHVMQGALLLRAWSIEPNDSHSQQYYSEWETRDELLPKTCLDILQKSTSPSSAHHPALVLDVRGWPLPAALWQHDYDYTRELNAILHPPDGFEYDMEYSTAIDYLTMPGTAEHQKFIHHDVHLRVLWAEFILDTAVFAGFCLALLGAIVLIRLAIWNYSARIRLKICVTCTGLGVATTIIAAWAAALLVYMACDTFGHDKSGGDWGAMNNDQGAGWSSWMIESLEGRCSQRLISTWYDTGAFGGFAGGWPDDPAEDLVPNWAPCVRAVALSSQGREHIRIADGRGWPMLAMRCSWTWDGAISNQPGPFELHHGIALPASTRSQVWSLSPRALPLGLIWRGFLIDGALFSFAWLLLISLIIIAFTGRKRLRMKRGLCPHCAYPIGSSSLCTECGAAVVGAKTN